jgi:hypothetical protein
MFRRNLLILLSVVWVIMPPLAQACASHCAGMHSAVGAMPTAESMPDCQGAGTPAGGATHAGGGSMAGFCMFAASAALPMSVVSISVQITGVPAVTEFAVLPSLTTIPPDKPPRG